MSRREEQKNEFPLLITASKLAGRAIMDFGMLQEGDKVAVAVSGGKDSISLLHILRHRQRVVPIKFEFAAVHIDFEFPDFNPETLVQYLQSQEFPCVLEKVSDLKGEKYEDIDCFRWSWNRRKALFQFADREGFSKIAFGHHMDDIAETIILNQFYRGEIGAMKPKQTLFGGKITLIRPLAYEREENMRILAEKLGIKSIGGQSKCANDDTSHRMKIKQMLKEFEKDNPDIVKNIFHSLKRVREDYLLETEKVEADG